MARKKETKKEKPMSMEELRLHFNKKMGGEVLKLGSEMTKYRVPTGSPGMDRLFDQGIVRGKTYMFLGNPSTAKSTTSMIIGGQFQKHCRFCSKPVGGKKKCCSKSTAMRVLIVDLEKAVDPDWMQDNGMDPEKTWVMQPTTGESAIDIVKLALRSGDVDLVIYDSIAHTTPKDETENDADQMVVGRHAILINKAFRIWKTCQNYCVAEHGHDPTIIAVNQWRQIISFTGGRTMYGGLGQKFAADVIVHFKRVDYIKQDGKIVGSKVEAKTAKNKLSGWIREITYDMYFKPRDYGLPNSIDHYSQLAVMAKEAGILVGASWMKIPGVENTIQGVTKVAAYFRENPDVYANVWGMTKRVWAGEDPADVLGEHDE